MFKGIKIIDFSTAIAGPLASQTFADYGADVIKIESSDRLDISRILGPFHQGSSGMYQSLNRNKRSLGLNLKAKESYEILQKLLQQSDILVHNFRGGVMERLKLDYKTLNEKYPKLIYVSISGFGHEGPDSSLGVFDPLLQARVGYAYNEDPKNPRIIRQFITDKVTAVITSQAITAALYQRSQTNKGQHVRINILDCALWFFWFDVLRTSTFLDRKEPSSEFKDYSLYQTNDGYICIGAASWIFLENLLDILGLPKTHEKIDIVQVIEKLRPNLIQEIKKWSTKELAQKLRERVPFSEVLRGDEIFNDPQILANQPFTIIKHSKLGALRMPVSPIWYNEKPIAKDSYRPGPEIGQHTIDILMELGYSMEQAKELQGKKVLQSKL